MDEGLSFVVCTEKDCSKGLGSESKLLRSGGRFGALFSVLMDERGGEGEDVRCWREFLLALSGCWRVARSTGERGAITMNAVMRRRDWLGEGEWMVRD